MSRQHADSGSRLLKPRFVACALLLLFLVIFSMTVLVLNRQYSDLKKQALASDSTVTSLLSEFVLEHEKAAIALLQSYAARPLLIDAVKRKDVAKTRSHLGGMKKINEELDLTFITDKRGILWVNYPVFPEAVGKDLSYRDWYKGVSSGWKPYISTVFKLIVADQPLAVAVSVPIFDREGNVIGILANSQRVSFLTETIRRVPLQSYTKVTLLDRAGNTIYSNRLPYTAEITAYPFLSAVKEALQTGKSRIEIKKSQSGGSTVSATVRPIAPIEWTVIAEHRSKDVLRAGYPQFVTTAAMSLLFFTAVSLLLLHARKQALLADTERLLMMERKISEEERQRQMQEKLSYSEMRYFRLHESIIDGFVVTGMDGYIRECNQAFQHMLGYGPDEIMSLTYNGITPVKWHDLEKTIVEEQVIPRGHSEVYEKEYIRKDGTIFPVELRTYLVKDDKGSPSGMWAIVRDITEGKEAEERIRASLKEKEVLLKEIHHRVKNNLQIVSSLLFLQSTRTEHPEAVSVLRESRNRIKSMALIHERLYASPDLGSIDMGKYTRNLVSDLRHSYRPEDSLVRLTLTVGDISLGITEAVPCGLIINELVSNALKHAFPTGKEGELKIQLQRGNTNEITLTVSDNGIGLPEHVDFRESPSLGLSLINSLVEQLHGAIELDRRGGTAFAITFKVRG